jgi:hypothetical protein
MMERKFLELTTRSIKRMIFEFAIKMVVPVHCQYKERQAGSTSGSVCVCDVSEDTAASSFRR